MNARLEKLKERVRAGEHKRIRQGAPIDILPECERENLSWAQRAARLTRRQCEAERVVVEPDERIAFTRTLPAVPSIYAPVDWSRLTANHKLHELGPISNICADWGMVLSQGLLGRKQVALEALKHTPPSPAPAEGERGGRVEFLMGAIETIDAVLALAERYEQAAAPPA